MMAQLIPDIMNLLKANKMNTSQVYFGNMYLFHKDFICNKNSLEIWRLKKEECWYPKRRRLVAPQTKTSFIA